MEKIHRHISVPNSLAQECFIAGVFEEVDSELKALLRDGELTPKPLMVCSGGTSSRCAANGHWTLDLRKKYQQINFDLINNTVEVGAGISMASLHQELIRHEKSFPIGLSGIPGMGYLLTGGISPLSRSQGLAIDQILKIEGVWGNGESFKISKPTVSSNSESKLIELGQSSAC